MSTNFQSRLVNLYSYLKEKYISAFSIKEIQSNKTLQHLSLAHLFVFFITFEEWSKNNSFTIENARTGTHCCWDFFQNCGDFYFLSGLPHGYSQTFIYSVLLFVIISGAYFYFKKQWVKVHFAIVLLCLWKLLVTIMSYSFSGNYDYFHNLLLVVFLVFPHKLFFSKLSLVVFYFLSAWVKIHEGWVLGTYFSALETGIPLFPVGSEILMTNLVIILEMVFCWLLFSKNKVLQRTVLASFVLFHLYSTILVAYRYPATVIPFLLLLFLPLKSENLKVPKDALSIPGWALIFCLFGLQMVPSFIPGDEKLTREAGKYGLYMFEANHQFISHLQIYYQNGQVETKTYQSSSARNRCDPYRILFSIKNQVCSGELDVERVAWQLDHSINGKPFYRIVDESNACNLEYRSLQHNEWIRLPEVGAKPIGIPVKNFYQ